MNPLLLSSLWDMGKTLINRLIPDPTEAAKAEMELLKMQQDGAFKELEAALQRDLAQAAINQAEANSANPFVSGWRPAVGWIGVATLAYQYLARPILPWALQVTGHPVPELPNLDNGMFEMIMAMLGIGGLRSFDKLKGTSK